MAKAYISIQEAAEISGKSIQTIRRAIKAKKLRHRKSKTPQGFNYMINFESLCEVYKIKPEVSQAPKVEKKIPMETAETTTVQPEVTAEVKEEKKDDGMYITAEDFKAFSKNLEKMIGQHSDERQNFLRLVNTLQEKIFVLENQLNLLKAPKKKWYQVWK